jgi:hypothetical protein
MKLEFKPDGLEFLVKECTEWISDWSGERINEQELADALTNRLQEMLKKEKVVYGSMWGRISDWHDKRDEYDTHRALLVNLEKLGD